MPHLRRMDFGPETKSSIASELPPRLGGAYPYLTPAVDSDGNEVSGIRLPDISVPLAAYTGWNLRHPEIGAPEQILRLIGSTLAFPATKRDREASNDPRISIEERYGSLESYLELVQAAAAKLVEERFLLEEDVKPIVELAARRWGMFKRLTARSADRAGLTPAPVRFSQVKDLRNTERGLFPDPSPSRCDSHDATLQWVWCLAGHRHLLGASEGSGLRMSSYVVHRLIQVPLPAAVKAVDEPSVVVPVGDYGS